MYTGTLIRDLFAAVERAESVVRQRELSEVMELQRLYEFQVPAEITEALAGAA